MPSVHLSHVHFAYSSGTPVLTDVDLDLGPGWAGLVGRNGSGKTTLLRLIAGELTPDRGTVVRVPAGASPVICPQRVEARSVAIEALAGSDDPLAYRLRGHLGLDPARIDQWSCLSPGERKRWQIGAALAADPAILLLDEPTNHLDREARDVLLAALAGFGGVGVVVSHDRSVLARLPAVTLRLRRGGLERWRGGYDTARTAWQAAEAEQRAAYADAKSKQRRLARRLGDDRRDRHSAERRRMRERRTASPGDHDARSMERAGRAAAAEARLARQVEVTRRRLERAEQDAARLRADKDPGRSVLVDYVPAPKKWLMRARRPELRAGDTVVLRDIDVGVGRDDRIRVAGPNGAGKSTLLAALLAGASVPPDRLLYLPQELARDDGIGLIGAVRRLPRRDRGRVLSLVAALGVDPDPLLASEAPSPGEARKLMMAFGLGKQVWALVLDEPTNHLDVPSIERLEDALVSYPGALVMVTHDDRLAAACTTTTWHVEDGDLRR